MPGNTNTKTFFFFVLLLFRRAFREEDGCPNINKRLSVFFLIFSRCPAYTVLLCQEHPTKSVLFFSFFSFWLNFATWRANELSPTRGLSRGKEIFLKDASLLIPCITSFFVCPHINNKEAFPVSHILFAKNKKQNKEQQQQHHT